MDLDVEEEGFAGIALILMQIIMANKGGQRSYPCLDPLRKVKHCDISSLVITAAIGAVQSTLFSRGTFT